MKKILLFILIFLMTVELSLAQDNPEEPSDPVAPKRIDLAIAEVMASNFVAWAGARYLREDNYSFLISWQSVEDNLRHGLEWDPNNFGTNFLNHPYQGSTYFNAARTNGMSFWESTPFTFAGSYMWEVFMEREYPAYNDLVTTTWGGVALGEILFRFSENVLDDRARGGSRVWRETAGFLLNPVGGVNRIIKGDMFTTRSSVNHIRRPFNGYIAVGGRGNLEGSDAEDSRLSPSFQLTGHYGKPFEPKSKIKPYDFFAFRLWTSKRDTLRSTVITAWGTLFGKQYDRENGQKHLLSISQNYDYYNAQIFTIGAMAFTTNLLSNWPLGKGFRLITNPALGFIALGAGNNEYVTSYQGRNYNFGWGARGKFEFLVEHQKFGRILGDYNYFSLYTREGAPGVDRLHVFDVNYMIKIWRQLGIGVEYFYYYRNAHYKNDPDVRKHLKGLRGLFSLEF
ncbi:MAG: DUF3943 domain-containing protein [bacterium]|nr:MAG: DUF3943 domain-containing protein [bacterium]